TVPYTMRNPLYHWTHMELKSYFGIDKLLNADTAEEIYNSCTEQLQQDTFKAQNLIKGFKVETICTTDDPTDTLQHHDEIKASSFETDVFPAYRPDKAYTFKDVQAYNAYLDELAKVNNSSINSLDDLLDTLKDRIDYFHSKGCRLADHGIEKIYHAEASTTELEQTFAQIRQGEAINEHQQHSLSYRILIELGKLYHQKGWVQQFHL